LPAATAVQIDVIVRREDGDCDTWAGTGEQLVRLADPLGERDLVGACDEAVEVWCPEWAPPVTEISIVRTNPPTPVAPSPTSSPTLLSGP
jgi:hypothetical protein